MKIDIIMMSRFGKSDGGRETWFYNFFSSLDGEIDKIKFKLYSIELSENNIVDEFLGGEHLVCHKGVVLPKKNVIPLTLLFILKLFFIFFKGVKRSEKVVAIGNIYEMMACFLCYPPLFYRGEKIIWLRTISRREFGLKTKVLRFPLIIIEKLLLKYYFDKVLTNGEDTGGFYKDKGIANTVINNGISIDKWYNEININNNSNKIKVSYIGRLEKNKGIEQFLSVIEGSRHLNNIEFIIVGKGSYRDRVESISNKFKNVSYLGEVNNSDLPNIMKNLDVSVALTFADEFVGGGGLSNALLEQMCSGMLIIAWDNPIFRQILDSQNSILINQGDIKAMIRCLEKISLNFNEYYGLRVISQKISLEYSFDKNKDKFMEVLNGKY